MYTVIKDFSDSLDDGFVYRAGDVYPRSGASPSEERVLGLMGVDNRQGVPLIKECVSLVKEDASESETDQHPSEEAKAKERPRRGRKKHA